MRRPFTRLLLSAVLVSACDQEMITVDSGTPATLEVRAYVDVNGNGTFDSSDAGIASALVTAAGPGGELSMATGAGGVTTFNGLPPGSYQLSISGAAPPGAVLASATNPVVAVAFRGGALTAEFRYANLPGSLGGRIFRDDNESGEYEAEADLPAAGIPLTLSDGASASATESGASAAAVELSTSTDADGLFMFDGVRPGTYTLTVGALETMEIVGGAAQTVVVGGDVAVSIDVTFTGTLLISMADARAAAAGQTVTVEGVVTYHPTFDNRTYFLEDGTAGLSVFDFNRPDIAIGDRIQITGSRGAFRGEVQVGSIISLENLGAEGAPDPRQVSGAEINDGTVAGQLVTLDATVKTIEVLSFGNQRVTLTDGSGTDFPVFADSRTGVVAGDWTVGTVFAVTGVVGTDDRDALAHRIEVRMPSDVVRGGSVVPLADARGMPGETVVVQGVITWQNQWDDRIFFFQDGTGGISSFFGGAPSMQRGDLVRIQGTIGAFRGETQISPDNLQVLGNVTVPNARGVTGAEVNAGVAQGELVTVTGVIQSIDLLSFGNHNVTIRDAAGTDLVVFVDSRNGVTAGLWPAIGSTVRVSGILGTDDRNDPAPRIELRDIADIVVGTPGQVSIAEARSMPGATLTVEAVVTWQNQWDARIYFFQDMTGGVSTFDGSGPALAEGDRIRVTGTVGSFRGEVQLGSPTLTILGPGPAPDPKVVTGAQINDGHFQGQLVSASGTLMDVTELSFGNQLVTVRDGTGTDFPIFVDSRNGMSTGDWPAVGTMVQVVGVLGMDNRDGPPEGTGPRVEVRRTADVTTVTPAN